MTTPELEGISARLAAIEDRLDRLLSQQEEARDRARALTERLSPAIDLAAQVQPAVAMTADTIDEWAAAQIRRGNDVDSHVAHAAMLLQRLTDPEIARQLERLLDLLPRLLPAAELAATFEPTTAMAFDMLDEAVRKLDSRGVSVEDRFHQVLSLVERLTEPAFHAHLNALLDAAPALMAATKTGELFGRAVDEVMAASPAPVGLFGLISAMSRPEVQRVLGLAIAVADRVGQQLPSNTLQRS